MSNYLKYGLHALRTTLCAVNDRISQANVTSTKSSSSRKCRNDDKIELWKSFHFRAYCCSDGDGETARSIFVVVVLLFSVVCNKVDSVISLIANCLSKSNSMWVNDCATKSFRLRLLAILYAERKN